VKKGNVNGWNTKSLLRCCECCLATAPRPPFSIAVSRVQKCYVHTGSTSYSTLNLLLRVRESSTYSYVAPGSCRKTVSPRASMVFKMGCVRFCPSVWFSRCFAARPLRAHDRHPLDTSLFLTFRIVFFRRRPTAIPTMADRPTLSFHTSCRLLCTYSRLVGY
jgi:hypothetical protein